MFVIMKFRYRVCVALVLVVLLSIIYLAFNISNETMSPSHLGTVRRSDKTSISLTDEITELWDKQEESKDAVQKTYISTKPSFTTLPKSQQKKTTAVHKKEKPRIKTATADINTIDLLKNLNDNYDLRALRKNGTIAKSNEDETKLPKVGKTLEIIVVPHSHNDPGWHKTVDGYFTQQTVHTLNHMVNKLLKYPKMTFVWAEAVFLSMWWTGLDAEMKKAVKDLIDRRQLEIVGGGWVVPDEANTHYFALIDQMIEGHQWLAENMDVQPNNTWSLDPFGYSSVLPYLYKEAGFQNMVILRVHTELKQLLEEQRALEFFWRQNWDQSNETDIYTLMMPYMLYSIKHSCGPNPRICVKYDFRKIDGEMSESQAKTVHSGNVDEQCEVLLNQYRKKAALFRHNVVLIPIGDDFRFDRALEWDQQYTNYQQLFDHMNERSDWNVHARFGTIQDYFDTVKAQFQNSSEKIEKSLPSLVGDFFPYTDHSDDFWTGYFTTRPVAKSLSRDVEVYLRSADILNTLASFHTFNMQSTNYDRNSSFHQLATAHQHLGLFQHHDGITGTARNYVAIDYEKRLAHALMLARNVFKDAATFLLSASAVKNSDQSISIRVIDPPSSRVLKPSESILHVPNGGSRILLFNNLPQQRSELIRLVIEQPDVAVHDNSGAKIVIQVSPIWNEAEEQFKDVFELSFIADLSPMSFTEFNIVAVEHFDGARTLVTEYNGSEKPNSMSPRPLAGDRPSEVTIENSFLHAIVSTVNGQLVSIACKHHVGNDLSESIYPINLQLLTYTARRSGAYIFSPVGPATDLHFKASPAITVVTGPIFSEVRIIHQSTVQILRLVNCSGPLGSALEISNIVEMMTAMDDKELIMRINSTVQNNGVFYTDLNGYHVLERRQFTRFMREANYYPFTSIAFLQDSETRLSLITANPHGVSSQGSGSIEVMLDRRLKYDDGRGLGEGVLDNRRVVSQFYLLVEHRKYKGEDQRLSNNVHFNSMDNGNGLNQPASPSLIALILADRLRNYPIVATSNRQPENLRVFQLIRSSLPCDVAIVNLRSLSGVADKSTAALIIHGRGYDSELTDQMEDIDLQCNVDAGTTKLVPSTMFNNVNVRRITLTSLSLMHDRQWLVSNESIEVKPEHLYTFKLAF